MFLSLAKKLCSKSKHHQHHHGVIVISGGAIKATGFNQTVTHAEVHALAKMWPSERKGAKVFSYRFGNNGKWTMAKPCVNCEKYLRDSGIKVVYYTNFEGKLEKMKL